MTHSSEVSINPENKRIEALQENFCGIFNENKRTEAEELFETVVREHQADSRKYHNLEHIEKMLDFLKTHEQEIKDVVGVKLATYFHDIVYDPKAKDNEEKSAEYAQDYVTRLGIPKDIISHVLALIRATEKHKIINDDSDSAIFLDGDLAILGSSEEEYGEYAKKIREEYLWVPDEQYRIGRKKVLQGFLDRPKIYFTQRVIEELEQQARRNIKKEITDLS
jgi:predicted metal-dependent HD superfamily phosphohydrolase